MSREGAPAGSCPVGPSHPNCGLGLGPLCLCLACMSPILTCRDPILTVVGTPAPHPISPCGDLSPLGTVLWRSGEGLHPEPGRRCVGAPPGCPVGGQGPWQLCPPRLCMAAPRGTDGVPRGLPAWACGLGVVLGVAWPVFSELQAGWPHAGPTDQWPLGTPSALGVPHGPHVCLLREEAAPGRPRSGDCPCPSSVEGETPALTQSSPSVSMPSCPQTAAPSSCL